MASKDSYKLRAQNILRNEIARHGFPSAKTLPCSRCGISRKDNPEVQMEYHHSDYSKPLDVVPLCRKCHGEMQKEEDPNFKRSSGHELGTFTLSEDSKQKISKAQTGKKASEETRKKMSQSRINYLKRSQKGI